MTTSVAKIGIALLPNHADGKRQVLTGLLPFSHLQLDTAIMRAVDTRGERPDKIPMECNGVSYENTWKVAEMCWSRLPEARIPISDALYRLREDPSLV